MGRHRAQPWTCSKRREHVYGGYHSDGVWIDVARVSPTEGDPSETAVRRVADKIRRSGHFQALLVWGRTNDERLLDDPTERFDIEDGHHRFLAVRLLGLDKVPVILGKS